MGGERGGSPPFFVDKSIKTVLNNGTMDNREQNRQQLKQCFLDLAQRAKELNEPYIYSVCLVLAGSIAEESDATLSLWVGEFAKIRISMIEEEKLGEE